MLSFRLVRRSVALLGRRDQLLLALAALLQTTVALLDLFAVLVLGVVAAGAASQGGLGPGVAGAFGGVVDLASLPIVWLAAAAGTALIAKSLLSLALTRRIYRFLANRQAMVSGALAQRLLTGSILDLQRRSSQQTAFALIAGVNAATVETLGPAMVVAAEFSLIVLLTFGLVVADPLVAVFAFVFFGALATVLQLGLGRWARRLGDSYRLASISSMESLQHAMRAYREVKVSGRRALFIERFTDARWQFAKVQADTFVLSQFGKYVFEIGLVAGGGALVLLLVQTRELVVAITILTVFLVASSRLVPSLLRMQSAFSMIRNSAGMSKELFDLVDEVGAVQADPAAQRELALRADVFNEVMHAGYPGFRAEVHVDRVSLTYPAASRPALVDVSLTVTQGKSVALVGPTGSGKSTLADIILGVLEPTSGAVHVSGVPAGDATSMWPGAMAYVPQDVAILSGAVRSNVALGIPNEAVDDVQVWTALEQAHLRGFIESTADGLDTLVGENGVKLSGGQRQRLGLARALYARPRLLVLDEATSALDADTEHQISAALRELAGEVTLIVIAHRLATIRDADQVLYLDHGHVKAIGPFEEVRAAVPDFDRQAQLLGL